MIIYSTPPYDRKLIFKQSKASFPSPRLFNQTKEPCPPYYLLIAAGRIGGFIPSQKVLVRYEMATASFWI